MQTQDTHPVAGGVQAQGRYLLLWVTWMGLGVGFELHGARQIFPETQWSFPFPVGDNFPQEDIAHINIIHVHIKDFI